MTRGGAGATADLPQFALEASSTWEQPAVEFVEIVTGRKEHESAWHAHGNPDGAAIELNYKALAWH